MMGILAIFVVALIHGSYASLLLRGPTQPVLQGDSVTLECLVSDSELNITQVHFERFSKFLNMWYRLEPEFGYFSYRRCYLYDVHVQREASRLTLSIGHATSFSEGPYRCVSEADNTTAADNSSQPLTFKVHYMGELSVYREGSMGRYMSSLHDLRVRQGDDVELECSTSTSSTQEPEYSWQKAGGDWILPSSKLTLKKVGALDGGEYTCMAQHPVVTSLIKRRTISITVLPEDAPWYECSSGRLILMTSAASVAFLVLILSMSVFLCRRAKQAKSSKGPIDDHSQKKPIYRGSKESLPSTCGDKQPLV